MTALDPFHSTTGDSWTPLNLTHLPEEPPTPPQFGGFGIVYQGKRHVFSGPQESAKTIAAYTVGIETLRANPAREILIIDFEMGPRATRTRLRELGASDEELADILYVDPEAPATTSRIAELVALEPLLVILDAASGAYSLQGLEDNSRSDAEKFHALYVLPFFHAGIATIVIDHVVKNVDSRGKYTQGSGRKTEVGEVHLGFDTISPIKRGTTGIYKVVTHKDRDGWHQRGQLAEFHLSSDPDTHQITWEWRKAEHLEPGETFTPTKVMQHISELMDKQTSTPTKNQMAELAGGQKKIALLAINELVRLGYITQTDGPNRSHLLTQVRPFTVLEWENAPDHRVVPGGSQVVPRTTPSGGSHSVPPYGGRNHPDTQTELRVVPDETPDWSWVDELAPRDEPPDDLHDPPVNIPF